MAHFRPRVLDVRLNVRDPCPGLLKLTLGLYRGTFKGGSRGCIGVPLKGVWLRSLGFRVLA